eukprot:TRINITY_DN3442_c0_g1_i4.p1 TRINITY_DN3442_c0_g1~~TRINITY_DN3442_c0_g1_i4.p1  ORF type:complete len:393 (-),score=129.17 TRINITY_DN3442_c0_g1_i4:175-1353(-)
MGLAFLNKKSWHTGSFQNIEKVWQAEQKEKERQRAAAEQRKKLKEERHLEELKRLQVEAGLIPRSHLERMDWMYEGGSKVRDDRETEQFLLGKPVGSKEMGSSAKDTKDFRIKGFKEAIINPENEAFTRLHEDPIFAIRQQELAHRESLKKNPILVKQILDAEDKKSKKSKKDKKKKEKGKEKDKKDKDRKDKKKKKDKNGRKSEDREHRRKRRDSRSYSRSRSRSNSRSRKRARSPSSSSSESRSRSTSRDRTRSRETERSSKSQQSSKAHSLYESYMQKRLGPLVKVDSEGGFKPDFGINKKKRKDRQVEQLTEEERNAMIAKMKADADRLRDEKLSTYEKEIAANDREDNSQKAQFLRDVKSNVYGGDNSANTLEDRVSRNRYFLSKDV